MNDSRQSVEEKKGGEEEIKEQLPSSHHTENDENDLIYKYDDHAH